MNSGISKISYCRNISLISLSQAPGDSRIVAELLTALAQAGICIDMISQTAPRGGTISVSFSLSDNALPAALTVLGSVRGKYPGMQSEVLPGNFKIAFYDKEMVHTPGVAARVFSALSGAGVQVMLITTSDVDISLLISAHDLQAALETVCKTFGVEPQETAIKEASF